MRRVGYYHLFPFQNIEQGASLVIWGMGEIGQHYVKQILQTEYCNIEYAVEEDWQEHKDCVVKIKPMLDLKHISRKTYIVIANDSEEMAEKISQRLLKMNIKNDRIVWNDIIIGDSMVMKDQLDLNGSVIKRIGFYHVFPFSKIKKNENIIIWGIGEVGRHYVQQIKSTNYYRIEAVIDSKWESAVNNLIPVYPPTYLENVTNVRIVIANGNYTSAERIKERILQLGIDANNILWEDLIVTGELSEWKQENKLYSSESALSNRMHPQIFAGVLMQYDVISFCVFDVLIFCAKNRQQVSLEENTGQKYFIPNSYMLEVYKILLGEGKKIICFENETCEREKIINYLRRCGYQDFEDIFVSSQHLELRSEGDLFQHVKKTYGNRYRCVHVGRNNEIDVTLARSCGIDDFLYRSIEDYGRDYRPKMISEQVEAVYSLIVNRRLHQDWQIYDRLYEYGVIGGGLLVMGFVKWIRQQENLRGFDKVIFLSSDNNVTFEVYQMLYGKKARFFYWSKQISVRIEKGVDYNESRLIKRYLKSVMRDSKHIALVDVSEHGKCGLLLSCSMKEMGIECGVDILTISNLVPFILHDNSNTKVRIHSYIDKNEKDTLEKVLTTKEKIGRSILFSAFFNQTMQNMIGVYEANGRLKFKFSQPIVENAKMANELKDGTMCFCRDYLTFLNQNKVRVAISGSDAYIPFLEIAKEISVMPNPLESYRVVTGASTDGEIPQCQTLKECVNKQYFNEGELMA